MSIFSESSKPFAIHRKSSLASYLKSSVSEKLLELLGDYTDDILAEYITVLVCNGKDQYQARDDLEAFLGEKSGEFVSWLWNLLQRYAHPSSRDIDRPDMKNASATRSHGNDAAEKDSRSGKLSGSSNHGSKHAHSSRRKEEKIHHSTSASDPVLSNSLMQQNQNSTAPLNKVNTEKLGSQTCQNQIPRKVGATENSIDGLTSEVGGSTAVSAARGQSTHSMEKFAKVDNSKCSELYHQPASCVQKGEVHVNSPSSTSEDPCTRKAFAANVLGRSLSTRSEGPVSTQIEKSRGSVWDRLGKPSDDTPEKIKSADASFLINTMKDDISLNQHALKPDLRNGELNMNTVGRVYRPAYSNNPMESKELNHSKNTMCKPNVANNIGRKRHFSEVTCGPTSGCDSLVGERNMNVRVISQDVIEVKHQKATTTELVSEVLDVKQRLSQIEIEMLKLRAKQSKMEREGNPNLLSQSGASKHPRNYSEGDIESRTVTVTNVHFAASKEAISSLFMKCGTVVNIVILVDKATAQPKGAAYVSFANKESVEKAVALSGTTFFSRTIRVFKKPEAAAATSGSAPLAGQSFKSPLPCISNRIVTPHRLYHSTSHLHWRREPVPAPAAVTPKKTVEDEKVSTSAPQQLLNSMPSKLPIVANSSTGEPPANA